MSDETTITEPATETRICHFCGATVGAQDACAACAASWPDRPAPHDMTGDEREAEMRSIFGGPIEVPFPMVHERIEALVGRPVWTHELGLNAEGLCIQARWDDPQPTMREIIELIPEEKRVVVEMPVSEGECTR